MKQTIFVLLASAFLATSATAGSWWEKVSDIAVSDYASLEGRDNTLFIYDDEHAYRSVDGGNTWEDQTKRFTNGIFTIKNVGKDMYAFATRNAKHKVDIHKSADNGETWSKVSTLNLPVGQKLCDVSMLGTGFYAISTGNSIYTSWDLGSTWTSTQVDGYIGSLIDFAAAPSVWIAVGTKGTMWSSNSGKTWNESYAPIEVGAGITQVETYNGTVYAGGHVGAAKFDVDSRSWNPANKGLPVFASLVAEPMSFKTQGGVLFGVFQTYDGVSSMLRIDRASGSWVKMQSAGLPPHNQARNSNFTVLGNRLYLYYHSSDIGFVGLYKGTNDAPTSVEEEFARNPTFTAGPNPARDFITVNSTGENFSQVSVIDMQGNVVDVQNVTGTTLTLATNRYAAGMYQIRVSDGKTTTQRPIVIQR